MISPRLLLLSSLVEKGSRVADVGTDHGYLPIYLRQNGLAVFCVATDLREGPLSSAKANLTEAAVSGVETRLCDGLAAVSPDEVDTVVMAGMGGETIIHILSEAPWVQDKTKTLLLQPMSAADDLRRYLAETGFETLAEPCVEDGGHVYAVMKVRFGANPRTLTEAEALSGKIDPTADAASKRYLDGVIRALNRQIQSLSASPRMADRKAEIEKIAAELSARREETHAL